MSGGGPLQFLFAPLIQAANWIEADPRRPSIILVWTVLGIALLALLWPRGRGLRLARQIVAVAVLAFREGLRLKVLWTVLALALVPSILAYYSDADGTHVGRASLILNYCLFTGEVLGAVLIVFLSALSVSREIENRIMYVFGTKPIPRWAILVGKALGFWVVDLVFLLGITLMTAALVRAVPARPEARETTKLAASGTWADLHSSVLTTREYQLADEDPGDTPSYRMIAPGKSRKWFFSLAPGLSPAETITVRFQFSSSMPFASSIPALGFGAECEGQRVLFSRTENVPQDRPFDMLITAPEIAGAGKLMVTVTASDKPGHFPAPAVVGTVKLGLPVDGFASNMAKAFLLMALQGWVLAFITVSWSGALSFPVTVALGAILVLGGEMSRQALALMESSNVRAQNLGIGPGESALQKAITSQLRVMLQLLPDFRVMGGPTAFVDGQSVSGWAIGQAVLMMGVVRTIGWSLPGAIFFQKREVGK